MNPVDMKQMVDAYLDGELSGDQLIFFENELKTNKELSQILELNTEINSFIKLYAFRKNITEIVLNYSNEQKNPEIKKISSLKKYIIAAASILVIIISTVLFYRTFFNKPVNIFQEYYFPLETFGRTRGVSVDIPNFRSNGMSAYDQKKYSLALLYFEKILSLDSLNYEILLYSGIAAIENTQYSKSEKYLDKVVSYSDYFYSISAQWYLGLCYIKTGKKIKAISIFTNLSLKDNDYQEKSKEILTKLNEL